MIAAPAQRPIPLFGPWASFVAAQGTIVAFAALLLLRRAAGALERPAPVLAACAAVAAASFIADIGRRRIKPQAPIVSKKVVWIVRWLPSFGVLLVAAALSPPWAPVSFASLVWPLALATESIGGWMRSQRPNSAFVALRDSLLRPRSTRQEMTPPTEDVCQRFVRRASASTGEEIAGLIAIRIAAGQRLATAHAAFCPPLAGAPRIEYRLRDRSGGDIGGLRIGSVQSYGVRFEIKLPRPPARAVTYWLTFTARDAAESRAPV